MSGRRQHVHPSPGAIAARVTPSNCAESLERPPGPPGNPQPAPRPGGRGLQTERRWAGGLAPGLRDSRVRRCRSARNTRRYRRSLNHKLCRLGIGRCYILTRSAPYEKSKSLGSGGSMVARLKLKEIDGKAPPGGPHAWSQTDV